MMTRTHKLFYLTTTLAFALLAAGQPCPSSHPFAYDKGNHCCENNKENKSPNNGKGCDGGIIGNDSTCCKDDKFVKCPNPPCVTNGICTTNDCNEASRSLSELMNPDADPCDDFYEFACGKFLKDTKIPPDESYYNSAKGPLEDNIDERGKNLLEEVPTGNSQFNTDGLARAYYKSCMNEIEIENAGLAPAKKLLKYLGGWPAVEGANWDGQGFEWWKVVPLLGKFGLFLNQGMVMWFTTANDQKDPQKISLYMDQPFGYGGDFNYRRLSQGFANQDVQFYYEYLVKAAKLMGADNATAHRDMKESLEFEIEMARLTSDAAARREEGLYNPRAIRDLDGQPGYPPNLTDYINSVFSYAGVPEVKFHENDTVIVRRVNYAQNLSDLLSRTSSRAVANFILSRTYQAVEPYLGNASRSLRVEYLEQVQGVQAAQPRWQQCVREVGFNVYDYANNGALNLAAASLYAREYLPGADKTEVESIVTGVGNGWKQLVQNSGWMDDKTKIHGKEKIDGLNKFIGYPKEILDPNKLNNFFKGLTLTGSFFSNHLELDKFWTRYRHRKYLKPYDKNHFAEKQNIAVSHGYFWANTLKVPAGMLQGTYYNSSFPISMNYGGIGAYVGEMMGAGLSGNGFHFDKDGKLANWVGNSSLQQFKNQSKCLIEQYGKYQVLGIKVNGTRTLDENIQDHGGARAAYLAYREYEKNHGQEKLLPGHNLNHKQLFWLRRAQQLCSVSTVKSLTKVLKHSTRSPDQIRIRGSLSNDQDFANDYQCHPGSKMNPVDKCGMY